MGLARVKSQSHQRVLRYIYNDDRNVVIVSNLVSYDRQIDPENMWGLREGGFPSLLFGGKGSHLGQHSPVFKTGCK